MPTPAQLAATEAFMRDQQKRYHVPASQLFGHRELGITICPGDQLFAWLADFRKRQGYAG
jgi:hypothetical protein